VWNCRLLHNAKLAPNERRPGIKLAPKVLHMWRAAKRWRVARVDEPQWNKSLWKSNGPYGWWVIRGWWATQKTRAVRETDHARVMGCTGVTGHTGNGPHGSSGSHKVTYRTTVKLYRLEIWGMEKLTVVENEQRRNHTRLLFVQILDYAWTQSILLQRNTWNAL